MVLCMIHSLTGMVQSIKKQSLVLLVGPVAVTIVVPDESLFPVETNQTLYTYLHWNQEQGPSLYGFCKEIDRSVFLLIISCSGIGPRIGLAVLAQLGVQGFLEAVRSGDEKPLTHVHGIGAKKAEQMLVQLKHKIGNMSEFDGELGHQGQLNMVMEALLALNYSRPEISRAIAFVRSGDAHGSFDYLLRQALSFLSK